MATEIERREMTQDGSRAYRERRRRGALVVAVEVELGEIHALERLGLLAVGERDPDAIADAVARFMATAGAVAEIGDALYPHPPR